MEGSRIHRVHDTTHKTNGYRMKLGMCSMDGEGHTIVLAVSLLKYEDAVSFAWAFFFFFLPSRCGVTPRKSGHPRHVH